MGASQDHAGGMVNIKGSQAGGLLGGQYFGASLAGIPGQKDMVQRSLMWAPVGSTLMGDWRWTGAI